MDKLTETDQVNNKSPYFTLSNLEKVRHPPPTPPKPGFVQMSSRLNRGGEMEEHPHHAELTECVHDKVPLHSLTTAY